MMKLLSIIITTYNRIDTLKECLNLVYKSDLRDVEDIIVVDDCSNDQTQLFLQKELEENRINNFICNSSNLGPARSRNKGVEVASGEFTLIMGDDVILSPNTIELFCEHLREYDMSNASLLGNIMPYADGLTAFEYWSCNGGSQFGHSGIPKKLYFDIGKEYYYTCNIITKTQILKDNPFNESFIFARYEDRELAYRLEKKYAHKIHYLPTATSYHKHCLNFKEWLKKFFRFTQSAIHFMELYPEDISLKEVLGVSRAIQTKYFNSDELLKSVDVLNVYCKDFFVDKENFEKEWIRNLCGSAFRYIQEFFRLNAYKTHLNDLAMQDSLSLKTSKEMEEIILKELEDDI